jgi:hypothetical protein
MEFSERNVEYGYAYASAAALGVAPILLPLAAMADDGRCDRDACASGEINRLAPAIMLLALALFVAIQLF